MSIQSDMFVTTKTEGFAYEKNGLLIMLLGCVLMVWKGIGDGSFFLGYLPGFVLLVVGGGILQAGIESDRSGRLNRKSGQNSQQVVKKVYQTKPLAEEQIQEHYAIKCPRCSSKNLQYLERKKVGIKRAIVGAALAGPAGAVMGGLTKKPDGVYKCLNCGNEFESK